MQRRLQQAPGPLRRLTTLRTVEQAIHGPYRQALPTRVETFRLLHQRILGKAKLLCTVTQCGGQVVKVCGSVHAVIVARKRHATQAKHVRRLRAEAVT